MSAKLPAVTVLLAVLAPVVLTPTAAAESYRVYGAERFFSLEWAPAERCGRPAIVGSVTNDGGLPAARVRLLVESLDAAGQVAATTIGYVAGHVLPGARFDFEVRLERPAPAYRVVVLSWEWVLGIGL